MNTTTTTALVLHGETPVVTPALSAIDRRDELIRAALACVRITTPEDAVTFASVMKELSVFQDIVEANRKEVKAPVLDLGRKIDSVAQEVTKGVADHWNRLRRLLGAYQAEQRRLEDERIRKAQEEERRIREKAEAEIRAAQKQAEDEAAELRAKAERARLPENAQKHELAAQNVLDAAHDAIERKVEETRDAIVTAKTSAVTVPAARIEGVKLRRELRFEVTNPVSLYEAAPYLVTITPNAAAIQNALRGLGKDQVLPGVRHWYEDVAQ